MSRRQSSPATRSNEATRREQLSRAHHPDAGVETRIRAADPAQMARGSDGDGLGIAAEVRENSRRAKV